MCILIANWQRGAATLMLEPMEQDYPSVMLDLRSTHLQPAGASHDIPDDRPNFRGSRYSPAGGARAR